MLSYKDLWHLTYPKCCVAKFLLVLYNYYKKHQGQRSSYQVQVCHLKKHKSPIVRSASFKKGSFIIATNSFNVAKAWTCDNIAKDLK